MKHCTIYLYFLINGLLLLPGQVLAGGGDYYSPFYVDKSFNILPPALTKQRLYKRTSHFSGSYGAEEYGEVAERRAFNIKLWSDFLQRSPADTRPIVYEGKFPDDLDPEVKAYLTAAQAQQALVTQPQKDPQPYNEAIAKLQAALAQTDSDFLRQRYVYLIIRLAHYSKQYDRVEQLYAEYAKQRQQPAAEISLWIDALYAGALQRNGERAQAVYRFAQLFKHSQTRRLEARINFVIKTDAEWQALLALCQDDDEKALMYFIRSLKNKANSLQELRTIYQLAPNSPWVDEALVRELEYVQFGKDYQPMPGGSRWQAVTTVDREHLITDSNVKPKLAEQAKQRRTIYLTELDEIITQIRSDKQREDLFLSDFAVLYLKLLRQQPVTVAEVQALQAAYTDKARTKATKALEYFVYLENLQAIDNAAEEKISAYLAQLLPLYKGEGNYSNDRSNFKTNILDYTYIKLEPLYLQQKADWQPAKTYAAKNRGTVVLDNMLVVELRDFQRLLAEDNSQHNLLLQYMLKDMRQTSADYSLDEAMARKYLAADLPEKALTALSKAPKPPAGKIWRTDYNPFNTALSGNNRKRGTGKTLQQVMETLLTLQKQVAANPRDAQAYYLLGTLYYNMSWFGNSPLLLRYYRQTTNWAEGQIDLDKAADYYRLALKHSDDRNLSAKVLYALAKIEQAELYTKGADKAKSSYDYLPARSRNYKAAVLQQKAQGLGQYFTKLKAYENTDYFREVISQCADYRYFHSQ